MSPIMDALKRFEVVEANLVKLERLWDELQSLFPKGLDFTSDFPDYEDCCRQFEIVLAALPKIDGRKLQVSPPSPDGVGQARLDYIEIQEPAGLAQFEASLWASSRDIREYRFQFNQKRRALIRDALVEVIDLIDADLRVVREEVGAVEPREKIASPSWEELRRHANQIEVLLGSSVPKPPRWHDFRRHLAFGEGTDLQDIEELDWPRVKETLRKGLYGVNEPLPIDVSDLADLVTAKPRGPIITALQWSNLNDDGFERLIFALIGDEAGYENPEWLMRTRAPDRGRDLSVTRVITDSLSGTMRQRVIIQCKHWLSRSVTLNDASVAKEQTSLWTDPRVDVLVIATSGRFTADAVQWVERRNGKGDPPRLEMWPESHLERLLATRPALIADFGLR